MEIDFNKKSHILRILPLGIDFFTACIQAGLSFDEIEFLEKDEDFQSEVECVKGQEEERLLKLYKETAENSARVKLNHSAIMDLLTLLKPNKYGKVIKPDDENSKSSIEIQMPDNGRG